MSVNPKEKAMLQEMWNKSQVAGADLPDGTYQFLILSARFHMSDKGRPQFKTKLRVVGGGEEYVGKELETNDNLETPENMGWFKKKLARLNVAAPEDFDELVDGTLAEQVKGKKFEGQVKAKNDFLNVYVNRLLGEEKIEDEEGATSEDQPEEGSAAIGFSEGDVVCWPGHDRGEVVEILDDGKARVKDAENGTVYRVSIEKLQTLHEPNGATERENVEESEGSGAEGDETTLPTPEECEELTAPQVKKTLEGIGIAAAKVKQPRQVLHAFVTLAQDPKAKIELTEIAPLADALKVTISGTPIKDAIKVLASAVAKRVGGN